MKQDTFIFEGVTVKYRLRAASKDRRHLVVVFAGVSKGQHDFYGFDGRALDHVQGSVLWIKDSFDNSNAYYMCKGLVFGIERAVAALIDAVLSDLELGPEQCTLLGGSKGGSAALLFGLKYSYSNIVASVPQTRVGTYTREKLGDTFDFMAGGDHDLAEEYLNAYLPTLMSNPKN